MSKVLYLVLALMGVTLAAHAGFASPDAAGKTDLGQAHDAKPVDFAAGDPAIELRTGLSPYHAPGGNESDGSHWYMMPVANQSTRPVTRILLAGEAADAALHFFPQPTRAMIQQVASSDGGVNVERQPAFGRHAYRVTIPPATTAALAVRLLNAAAVPSVLAWSEPALVAYHRQLAIFIAAVAGLIGAAAAITGGLAAMTGHSVPRWGALTLAGVFAVWLATIGLFDAGWSTAVGGPYGFMAMLAGLTLAAAARLVGEVVPPSDVWPGVEDYQRWALLALVALALLAFVGLPGAAVLMNGLIVVGAAVLAAYLVRRGMTGSRSARVFAPSASVFALVTCAAAMAALGGFHGNPVASEVVGGFAAVGAVLLALAIAAGEEIGILSLRPAPAMPAPAPVSELDSAPAADRHPLRALVGNEPMPSALAAIGASHQGVFDLDFHSDALRLSREAASLIGISKGAQAIAHSSWIGRIHPEDRAVYKEALRDYRDHPGLAFRIEFRVRSESGRYPWFELRATMIGPGNRAERCLGLVADVTTRKETETASIERTLHDPLTRLGNRIALMGELDRLGRSPSVLTLAILDIDRFKTIHASLGDAGADAVLQHLAERLRTRFDGAAQIFRIGGDAFALLFAKGETSANAIGAELVEVCGAPFLQSARKIFAPVSVGVATSSEAGEPLDLLRNAELALRLAKRQGGGCARIYTRMLDVSAPGDAVALESDLRRGLEERQFAVYYQPIMRLSDRSVAGFEALLRWQHPERGLVSPSDFVAHAEETGLIVELGKFALSRATDDLARWQRFFPIDPAIFVSVNVSRRQLQDSHFESYLAQILDRNAVSQGSLRLEVTESAIAASEHASTRLARIHELGAGIAIDDFGTGLSTLSQLKQIPFDFVKVDKSFLARQDANDREGQGQVILGSIVTLAHELKRGLIVEGVESEGDALRLAAIGCEFAQGYYFSMPLTAHDALNFIALNYAAHDTAQTRGEQSDGESGAPGLGA